jgi:hypothetical protein
MITLEFRKLKATDGVWSAPTATDAFALSHEYITACAPHALELLRQRPLSFVQ